MARVARRAGVKIRLDEPITEILFDGRRAVGVRTDRGDYRSDALVINADFAKAMTTLVPDRLRRRWSDRKLARKRYSCVRSDSPTEDEIALANMHALSYYHAMHFPRRFEETYRRCLLLEAGGEVARWQGTLRHYVGKMSALDPDRRLLLKNPGYTAQIGAIRALWPDAKFVHIYRNPYVVFESARRALRTVLRELALQSHEHIPIDEIVLAMYPRMMRRLRQEADRLPSHAIVHVRFEALERDPLSELERIFRAIGLGDYGAARPRIEAYLHSIHDYRKSTYTFSKESVERVTDRWQPYVTRFGYNTPDLERCAA